MYSKYGTIDMDIRQIDRQMLPFISINESLFVQAMRSVNIIIFNQFIIHNPGSSMVLRI